MFSMITNIYNKKTKGPTSMELFTATGKLTKFFLTTRDVRCVHHGWQNWSEPIQHHLQGLMGGHLISDCTDTQFSVNCLYHAQMVLSVGGSFCVLCTKCMLHSNHRLTHDIPTHKTTSPSEWPFSYYIHSYHLVAEMWTTMKNNLLGKKFLSCSFCLYRFRKYVSYSFPTINFCNPRVHYEMPCIVYVLSDRLYLDGNIHYWQVSYDSYFLWKSLHVMKPGFRGTVLKEYCQMSGWNVS